MRGVTVVEVPYDSGRRGYRMGAGPAALAEEGLLQMIVAAGRDVVAVTVDTVERAGADAAEVSAFALAREIGIHVRAAVDAGRLPLVLAGNCISTVGALTGLSGAVGVVWFDAHADLNTPSTSPSGFLDGMAGATALGWCHEEETARLDGYEVLPESRLLLLGVRDLDAGEVTAAARSAVTLLPPDQMRSHGTLASVLDGFTAELDAAYLHIDLDVLDPESVGPANSFASAGGLLLDEAVAAVQEVGRRCRVAGATLSAYDPAVDRSGAVRQAATALVTAIVAADGTRP